MVTIKIILCYLLVLLQQDLQIPSNPTLLQQDLQIPNNPTNFVNDLAGVIDAQIESLINTKLEALSTNQGVEIAVLTLSTIRTYAPADVARDVGRKWGVGPKGEYIGDPTRNAGVVFLVVPKTQHSNNKGECFIATGRGVEGYITDARAGKICRDIISTHFRSGDYSGGIDKGISNLIALVTQHQEKANAPPPPPLPPFKFPWTEVLLGLISLGLMFRWLTARDTANSEKARSDYLETVIAGLRNELGVLARNNADIKAEMEDIWNLSVDAFTREKRRIKAERARREKLAEEQRRKREEEKEKLRLLMEEKRRKQPAESFDDDDDSPYYKGGSSTNFGGGGGFSGGGGGFGGFGGGGGFSGGGGGSSW